MNRAFPPETVTPCDHCGHELIVVVTEDGVEANDSRDYVWTGSPDARDHVFVCADCRVRVGLDD